MVIPRRPRGYARWSLKFTQPHSNLVAPYCTWFLPLFSVTFIMTNKMWFFYNPSEIIIVLLSCIFSNLIVQKYNSLKYVGQRFFLLTRDLHIRKGSEPLRKITQVATEDAMRTAACWTCLFKHAAIYHRRWTTPISLLKEEASITLPGGTTNGYTRYSHGHRTETTQVGSQFSSPHLKFHCQPDVWLELQPETTCRNSSFLYLHFVFMWFKRPSSAKGDEAWDAREGNSLLDLLRD
jgi:hypothetical protein